MPFQFTPCQIRVWEGRYSRIPGEASVFHVNYIDGEWWPTIRWDQDCGRGTCVAVDSIGAQQLAQAVNKAKNSMTGTSGGAFIINEYGKVIVPASDNSGKRMLVGSISGRLLFENPFEDGDIIDLSDNSGMECGDEMIMPYVGIPYNLSGRSQIYFYRIDGERGGSVYPQNQDHELISALRKVRRSGPVKFIVNPHGIVATKKPMNARWEPEEKWTPVYVGKINFNKCFTIE